MQAERVDATCAWRPSAMRYHEQLNNIRGILFYVALAVIAIGFLIDFIRR